MTSPVWLPPERVQALCANDWAAFLRRGPGELSASASTSSTQLRRHHLLGGRRRVGLAGIAVSFGGQALARLREFGMLRHLGFAAAAWDALLAWKARCCRASESRPGLALSAGWIRC